MASSAEAADGRAGRAADRLVEHHPAHLLAGAVGAAGDVQRGQRAGGAADRGVQHLVGLAEAECRMSGGAGERPPLTVGGHQRDARVPAAPPRRPRRGQPRSTRRRSAGHACRPDRAAAVRRVHPPAAPAAARPSRHWASRAREVPSPRRSRRTRPAPRRDDRNRRWRTARRRRWRRPAMRRAHRASVVAARSVPAEDMRATVRHDPDTGAPIRRRCGRVEPRRTIVTRWSPDDDQDADRPAVRLLSTHLLSSIAAARAEPRRHPGRPIRPAYRHRPCLPPAGIHPRPPARVRPLPPAR